MSRHDSAMARPVYLQQRTYFMTAGMAVECQKETNGTAPKIKSDLVVRRCRLLTDCHAHFRTHAVQQKGIGFDHLGQSEQVLFQNPRRRRERQRRLLRPLDGFSADRVIHR